MNGRENTNTTVTLARDLLYTSSRHVPSHRAGTSEPLLPLTEAIAYIQVTSHYLKSSVLVRDLKQSLLYQLAF